MRLTKTTSEPSACQANASNIEYTIPLLQSATESDPGLVTLVTCPGKDRARRYHRDNCVISGYTPLQLARLHGHTIVVELLLAAAPNFSEDVSIPMNGSNLPEGHSVVDLLLAASKDDYQASSSKWPLPENATPLVKCWNLDLMNTNCEDQASSIDEGTSSSCISTRSTTPSDIE